MSRFGTRSRPGERVIKFSRADVEADLGTLWLVGPITGGLVFSPVLVPDDDDITVSITGNQLNYIKQGSRGDWDQVSAGNAFFLAIADGRLFAWGDGTSFRTGLNTTALVSVPTEPLPSTGWTYCYAGFRGGCAIRDGELYTWGANTNFITGLNTSVGNTEVPTLVSDPAINTWAIASVGFEHGAGVTEEGTLYTWGRNVFFKTGLGDNLGNTDVPTQVGTDTDWAFIEAGGQMTVGLKTDGTMWSFGKNPEAGQGSSGNVEVPTQIGSDNDWIEVSVGNSHCMAIRSSDAVPRTWGLNLNARTGRGSTSGSTNSPLLVNSTNITGSPIAVSAVNTNSYLITSDGLYSCGLNTSGRTGQNTSSGNTVIFTKVTGRAGTETGFDRVTDGYATFSNGFLKKRKV